VIADPLPQWAQRLDELHLLTPIRIALMILTAIVLTVVVRRIVRRVLARTIEWHGASERVRAEARQRALASVVRSAVVGVIWATAVITIIGELGVNLGALIATATVVGGAVAFGAQTLVRDLIAGFFVLAEDQYGVGDQVDLGLARGAVDRISLRSVRLRDSEGRTWYVPHGNVMRVANSSNANSVPLDLAVSRAMSVAEIGRVAAELTAALAGEETMTAAIIGPPRQVGVVDIGDDRIVHRSVVDIAPGRGDEVRRAWRAASLDAFAAGRLVAPTVVVAASGATTEATE
jgi:small conductance mechanosensitive channel